MKILMYDNGQPYGLTTPYEKPLGGSEMSFLLLSKGLAELDHNIILLTSQIDNLGKSDHNRLHHNVKAALQILPEAECIIFNRSINPELLQNNLPKYLYLHDAFDQTHMLEWLKYRNKLTHIFCVSEWQKKNLNKYFNINNDQMSVIGNSIDYSLFYGHANRNLNKLVFAGIPYKGIDVLPYIFNDVCMRTKRDDLELHVFSSMTLYSQDDKDREFEESFSKLHRLKGAIVRKPVHLRDLAFELLTSSIYLSPQTYHETFGIMTVMAQAAGCLPVAVDNGATQEVIQNKKTGFITKGKNIWERSTYNEFVELICTILENDPYTIRLKASEYVEQWNYTQVARKVTRKIN